MITGVFALFLPQNSKNRDSSYIAVTTSSTGYNIMSDSSGLIHILSKKNSYSNILKFEYLSFYKACKCLKFLISVYQCYTFFKEVYIFQNQNCWPLRYFIHACITDTQI